MESAMIWAEVAAQRRGLADLLAGLAPSEWSVHSLCPGWTVRDVTAHLTLSTVTLREALPALIRARGNVEAMIHRAAVDKAAATSTDQLVTDLRSIAGSRRHPPGTKPMDPLVDLLVHGQDIARPLGLDRAMPVEAATASATRVWQQAFYSARKRFADVRFEATDAAITWGDGTPASGPVSAILLTMSGRSTALDDLAGPGAALVRRALAR